MTELTPNYNLVKQQDNEFVDITGINDNFDIIDKEIKNAKDKANEAFRYAGEGKEKIKMAITGVDDKVVIPTDATFQQLATCIGQIKTGVNTEDATAQASQILNNMIAYVKDVRIIGTMLDNGAVNITLTTNGQEWTVPKGFHNGIGKIKALIAGLVASVIKAGEKVGGITGTFTADANALAGDVRANKIVYVNGARIIGNMTDHSDTQTDLTAGTALTAANGYIQFYPSGFFNGNSRCYITDPDFIDTNIPENINLFGLQGKLKLGKKYATSTAYATGYTISTSQKYNGAYSTNERYTDYLEVTGLTFTPKMIHIKKISGLNGIPEITYNSTAPSNGIMTYNHLNDDRCVFTLQSPFYVSNGGFKLPLLTCNFGTLTNYLYVWEAWE